MEASARPSELVNCPSSLFPWVWLLRRQAGRQAAKASFSGNPSPKQDPSWGQQQQARSPRCSAFAHRTALLDSDPPGIHQAGEKVWLLLSLRIRSPSREPQFHTNSLSSRQSAGSHRPQLQRHQLVLSQTRGATSQPVAEPKTQNQGLCSSAEKH